MTSKLSTTTRLRFSRRLEQKLQERSATLYVRELERWNKRSSSR